MSDISINLEPATGQKLLVRPELAAALAALALMLVIAALSGFKMLVDAGGDNDSVLRLTQVRDLLAGQAWFDLTQYRLGPDGGVVMHWSRLVDAPIAGLILIARFLGASAPLAEMIAITMWPALLLAIATYLIVRIANTIYGSQTALPAAVLGTLALVWIGHFQPGRIDHHNLQLVLSLGMVLGLITGSFFAGVVAGCCAALSLAVGMETLPFVAIGGGTVAMLFLVAGEKEAKSAAGFGLGFAVAGAACFVATVPMSAWSDVACDAYSSAQAGVALLAGFGLFAVARSKSAQRQFALRASALAILGLAIGALALTQFPQCLADPYASLDQRLKTYWLDYIVEAQSALDLAASKPEKLLAWYVTPLIALVLLALRATKVRLTRAETILALILAGAYATSLWQLRGGLFAVPLATAVLAGWVARHRTTDGSLRANLVSVPIWLISMNVAWVALGVVFAPDPVNGAVSGSASSDKTTPSTCYATDDYAELAKFPAGTVLAISNLGSGIITYTHHRALAGPYHRNVAGNLAVLETLLADPQHARGSAQRSGATFIAVCRGNPETDILANKAPDSLIAQLAAGKVPNWLRRIAGNNHSLEIYGFSTPPTP